MSSILRGLDDQLHSLGADRALSRQQQQEQQHGTHQTSRSQELMRGLEMKANQLVRELASIQIQRIVRGFITRKQLDHELLELE